MKPGAANHLPAGQITDGSSAGGGMAPPPALLSYSSTEPTFLVSLPTRLGLIFAALVVPALLASVGWGVPDWDRVRTFAGAGAAVFGAAALSCCAVGYRRDRGPAAGTSRIRPWALAACLILGAAGTTLGGGAVLEQATAKRTYHCYSSRHHCQRNLSQVSMAILLYAHQNNGRLPDTLDDVLRAGEITSDVFICPVQAANPPRGGTIPYVYLGRGMRNNVDADVVVLHDRPIDHGDGMNVGYGDGHVEWHDLEQSKKILAELNAGQNPPRPEKLE